MKKLVNIILLLVVLISLFSVGASAASVADAFRSGLGTIEDFFSGGWRDFEKTVVFVVFFFLFFSTYLMGAKKAFSGELTRSHMVFAFVAAFLSSLIITVSMNFDWINLKYVAWGLIGILLLYLIHSLLLKIGLENKKFLAFLIALVIAALLIWLIWFLMKDGRPLDSLGRVSDWFGNLGRSFKGGTAGEGPLTPRVTPPVEGGGEVVDGGGGEEKTVITTLLASGKWWIPLLILLMVGVIWKRKAIGGLLKRKKKEGEEEAGEEEPEEEPEESINPIEKLIEHLKKILNRKGKVLNNLNRVEKNKKKIVERIQTLKKKIVAEGGDINKFIADIAPFLRDPHSKQFRNLSDEEKGVRMLISSHIRMFSLLRKLSELEKYIGRNANIIKQYVKGFDADRKEQLDILFDGLDKISSKVISALNDLFNLGKKGVDVGKELGALLEDKYIEKRISPNWIKAMTKGEIGINALMDEEFNKYGGIRVLVEQEMKIIERIIKMLEENEKEKKLVIVKPEEGQKVMGGNEIKLEANIEGIDMDTKEYKLMWFIKNSQEGTFKRMVYGEEYITNKLKELTAAATAKERESWSNRQGGVEYSEAKSAAAEEVLRIQQEINEIKRGMRLAEGNGIRGWISANESPGKAEIIARVYDTSGEVNKVIAQSDKRTILIWRIEDGVGVISYIDPNTKEPKQYRLRNSVGIGRHRVNDIILRPYGTDDENLKISKQHTIIGGRNNKFYIRDISTNGTSIGRGIDLDMIGNGHTIELQNNEMIVFPLNFSFWFKFIHKEDAAEIPELPPKLSIVFDLSPKITSISRTSGPTKGGIHVEIVGEKFTGDTQVMIGENRLVDEWHVDNTRISGKIPAGEEGTVDVIVRNRNGEDKLENGFTYVEGRGDYSPKITSISRTSGPTKGGIHVEIVGEKFTGDTQVMIGENRLVDEWHVDNTRISGKIPAGEEGTVDVIVRNRNGEDKLENGFTYVEGRGENDEEPQPNIEELIRNLNMFKTWWLNNQNNENINDIRQTIDNRLEQLSAQILGIQQRIEGGNATGGDSNVDNTVGPVINRILENLKEIKVDVQGGAGGSSNVNITNNFDELIKAIEELKEKGEGSVNIEVGDINLKDLINNIIEGLNNTIGDINNKITATGGEGGAGGAGGRGGDNIVNVYGQGGGGRTPRPPKTPTYDFSVFKERGPTEIKKGKKAVSFMFLVENKEDKDKYGLLCSVHDATGVRSFKRTQNKDLTKALSNIQIRFPGRRRLAWATQKDTGFLGKRKKVEVNVTLHVPENLAENTRYAVRLRAKPESTGKTKQGFCYFKIVE